MHLYGKYLSMHLRAAMQHKASFTMMPIGQLLVTLSSFAGVWVLFDRFSAVEGYTYAGASPETFTVDGSGAAIEVTLNYTKNAPQVVNSIVTFHHVDANGAPIAAEPPQELAPNNYSASGYQVAVQGYTYTSANPESFQVDGKGTAVEVTLTYTKDLVASKVTFHHVDADGKPVVTHLDESDQVMMGQLLDR